MQTSCWLLVCVVEVVLGSQEVAADKLDFHSLPAVRSESMRLIDSGHLTPGGAGVPPAKIRFCDQVLHWLSQSQYAMDWLELRRDQIAALDGLVKQYEEIFVEDLVDFSDDHLEVTQIYLDEREIFLQQVLEADQRKKLEQIAWQLRVRRVGFPAWLIAGDIAATLQLTAEQKKELKEFAKEFHAEKTGDVQKIKDEFSADLVSILSDRQKQQLIKLETTGVAMLKPPLGLLALSLEGLTNDDSSFPDEHSIRPHPREMLPLSWSHEVVARLDTTLVYRAQLDGIPPRLTLARAIRQLFDPSRPRPSFVDGSQDVILEARIREWDNFIDPIDTEQMSAIALGARPDFTKILKETPGFEQAADRLIETTTSTLSPEQRQEFDSYCRALAVYRHGLVWSLLKGSLGEELEVCATQKRQLRELTQEYAERIAQRTNELEKQVFIGCLKRLDSQQRRQVQAKLGKELAPLPGNIDLLLWQLNEYYLAIWR